MLHSATSLFTMQIRMAPSPRDIIWQDIHKVRKYLQSTLMQVLTFIICFFMTIPTSQLTSLITAQTLGKMLGLTDRFKTGTQSLADSFVLFVWETLGPPIVVSLVNMGIIPYILHFMSLYQGFDTHSQVERSTMSKYFFFLFFNVFFVFTLIWPLWTLFQSRKSSTSTRREPTPRIIF